MWLKPLWRDGFGGGLSKKLGFTLAEVLITLGIIGVVAALTMPTLIQNHQKQAYVTGIKKGISVVENMFKKMQADEGVSEFAQMKLFAEGHKAGYGDGCPNCEDAYGNSSVAENLIPKYLKVVKTCTGTDCDIKYKGGSLISDNNGKYKLDVSSAIGTLQEDKWAAYTSFSIVKGFYTSDGMVFYFINGQGDYVSSAVNSDGIIQVYIDTNGEKGPNILGRDLFGMYFRSYDGKMIPIRHPSQYSLLYRDGSGVLVYLMNNGWKMDY